MRPILFLVLVMLLALPFYLWGHFAPGTGLPFGLPVSALGVVVPAALATVMMAAHKGWPAAATLWKDLFDLRRAAPVWIALGVLLMPVAVTLAFLIAGAPLFPLAFGSLPLMLLLYLPGAAFEELGWTGYATRPLQARFGVVGAGLLIGVVWAAWHVIPWAIFQGHTWVWVAGQCVATILMRLIMGVIYKRGGGSLALATLFHAIYNVAFSITPGNGAGYDPWLFSLALVGPVIVLFWKKPEIAAA